MPRTAQTSEDDSQVGPLRRRSVTVVEVARQGVQPRDVKIARHAHVRNGRGIEEKSQAVPLLSWHTISFAVVMNAGDD